jgi:hypothetical protein
MAILPVDSGLPILPVSARRHTSNVYKPLGSTPRSASRAATNLECSHSWHFSIDLWALIRLTRNWLLLGSNSRQQQPIGQLR